MCYRRQFLHAMWPIQLACLSIVPRIFLSLTLCSASFLIRCGQPWSSLSFCSAALENLQSVYDVLSAVSNFQHHTKLCSKCSTLIISSLNLSPVYWWQDSLCLNAVFVTAIPDWIPRARIASLVIRLSYFF